MIDRTCVSTVTCRPEAMAECAVAPLPQVTRDEKNALDDELKRSQARETTDLAWAMLFRSRYCAGARVTSKGAWLFESLAQNVEAHLDKSQSCI